MNMKRSYLTVVAVLFASALALNAQDKPADSQGQGQRRGGGNPIIAALDANHDGEIDASEINNAPAALRKLDKNGDGKLTRDELRPANRNGGGGKKGKKTQ
jgi:hypothetical protein